VNGTGQLTIYENVCELMDLVEAHASAQAPEEEQSLRAAVLLQIDRTQSKVDRVSYVLANYAGIESACDREIKRLTALRNSAASCRSSLEGLVLHTMIEHGLQRLEGNTSKFKIQVSPGAVEVDDAEQVPREYKRETITTTIDRAAILKDIRAGATVPGARLVKRPLLKVA
jgi:hypothetical protein